MSGDDEPNTLDDEAVIEALAAVEHERWSHWQRYLHGQCRQESDGSLTIPAELAARWSKQASTDYSDLSEPERESDREQVRRYLPLLIAALRDRNSYET